jgi:hypothetical protein
VSVRVALTPRPMAPIETVSCTPETVRSNPTIRQGSTQLKTLQHSVEVQHPSSDPILGHAYLQEEARAPDATGLVCQLCRRRALDFPRSRQDCPDQGARPTLTVKSPCA